MGGDEGGQAGSGDDEVEVGWFFEWTPNDEPGFVMPVSDADDDPGWQELRETYCSLACNTPFERILTIARELGVTSVVVERRYIDHDYRSEHSHFYSTTFKRFPSVCHRLHFFTETVNADLKNLRDVSSSYRGYSVMRPLPSAPVGRTMIAPPPSLNGAILCLGVDTVHLWGQKLTVRAMPFVSQDMEYLRCAHSSLWMVLYHAYLRHGMPRRMPHEIYEAALGGPATGRRLPSDGLSPGQVITALQEMNMSSGHIRLPLTRADSRARHRTSLFGIICRCVNSQMPPIVYSQNHAWVVSGYRFHDRNAGHDSTTLYVHNDVEGPYLAVETPFVEEMKLPAGEVDAKTWKAAVPPLPRKLYMTGERAEMIGRLRLIEFAKESRNGQNQLNGLEENEISWRSYAIESYQYQADLRTRLPLEIAFLFETTNLPRWVWVVEAHEKARVRNSQPSVVGELVIDATASHLAKYTDPVVLLRHISGEAFNYTPDHGEIHRVIGEPIDPYESGQVIDDGQNYQSEMAL